MFRGILAIALIFSLLASQLVLARHVHAGMSVEEQHEHDAHPHVHLAALAKHSHHQHSHRHQRHKHSHRSHTHHQHAQSDVQVDPLQCIVSGEHDADAIYLQGVTLANQVSSKADQQLVSNPISFDTVCLFETVALATNIRWHPPDKPQPNSDIYLALRNLRI